MEKRYKLMGAVIGRFLVVIAAVFLLDACASAGGEEIKQQFRLDWYRWASVSCIPYIEDTALPMLCDGNVRTGARGTSGPEVGSAIGFTFPEVVTITELRLLQQGANRINVFGSEDGKTEKLLASLKMNSPEGNVQNQTWVTAPINKKLKTLKLLAVDGKPGYRSCYPVYREIELYTDKLVKVAPLKAEKARLTLSLGKQLELPVLKKKTIELTPCVDLWMAGAGRGAKPLKDYENSPGFKHLLTQLKELDADGVRLFLESSACDNKVPWKSKIAPNYGNEVLKTIIDTLHKHGLKSYIFMHAWCSPFQKEGQRAKMPYCRWDYPYEQSDFIFSKGLDKYYKVKYPCIISENDFRDKWLGMLSEVTDRGIDGAYVLPDEYYFKGHYLPKTNCPYCQREFKKRYGYDSLPKKVEDTEKYRKWKQFEYDKLCEQFNYVAGELKKKKPGMELICCPLLWPPSNTRMEHGTALDVYGKQPNFTAVQVYGGDPKRAEGAFPGKLLFGSIQCLSTSGARDFPIIFYDYLMDLLMNGCKKINFYRLNYVESYWQTAVKAFKMMRLLESWGLVKSKSAAETCLLMSRASEDWWQLKAECQILDFVNKGDTNLLYMDPRELAVVWSKTKKQEKVDPKVRETQIERFRGMYSTQYMENLLKKNGIQYDVRYSERPETLSKLDQYKLIILPFNYAMSKTTFAKLKQAVDKGSQLVIVKYMAEADELGNKYKEPLLKSLVGNKNVTYLDLDLLKDWNSKVVRRETLALIKTKLNSKFTFNPNQANVRYFVRKVSDSDLILYLGNMERYRSVSAVVGLGLPQGDYSLQVCSSAQGGNGKIELYQGLINKRDKIVNQSLGSFNVELSPGEVKLIHVKREKGGH